MLSSLYPSFPLSSKFSFSRLTSSIVINILIKIKRFCTFAISLFTVVAKAKSCNDTASAAGTSHVSQKPRKEKKSQDSQRVRFHTLYFDFFAVWFIFWSTRSLNICHLNNNLWLRHLTSLLWSVGTEWVFWVKITRDVWEVWGADLEIWNCSPVFSTILLHCGSALHQEEQQCSGQWRSSQQKQLWDESCLWKDKSIRSIQRGPSATPLIWVWWRCGANMGGELA